VTGPTMTAADQTYSLVEIRNGCWPWGTRFRVADPDSDITVEYIIEAKLAGPWRTRNRAVDAADGAMMLAGNRAHRDFIGGRTLFRLVERTTITTDKILNTEEEQQ